MDIGLILSVECERVKRENKEKAVIIMWLYVRSISNITSGNEDDRYFTSATYPFLSLPGEPPVPWTHWLQSFDTYLIALGLTNVSVTLKKALLQHCLGAEGRRRLWTLADGASIT